MTEFKLEQTCLECKEPKLEIIEQQRITAAGGIEKDTTIYCKYVRSCPFLELDRRWQKEKRR